METNNGGFFYSYFFLPLNQKKHAILEVEDIFRVWLGAVMPYTRSILHCCFDKSWPLIYLNDVVHHRFPHSRYKILIHTLRFWTLHSNFCQWCCLDAFGNVKVVFINHGYTPHILPPCLKYIYSRFYMFLSRIY